jgi:hypothetical protein
VCHKYDRYKYLEPLCKCDPVLREPDEAARRGLLHDLRMNRDPALAMITDRDALMAIRDYPTEGVLAMDKDVALRAIEVMQQIAAAQLEGEDWTQLVEPFGDDEEGS